MLLLSAHDLCKEINHLTQSGTPYLFAIDFAGENGYLWRNPIERDDVYFSIGNYSNAHRIASGGISNVPASLTRYPISYKAYLQKYQRIQGALAHGDTFLANLTVATPISLNLSLEEVFVRAHAPYKLCVPGQFVAFSPERFIRTTGALCMIETCPMKGTIDASLPNAAKTILSDYKETAEHYTIVDLIRSDLARIATHIEVQDFRYIDRIETLSGVLLQVSSRIVGNLPENAASQLGDLLFKLLPAGSISGAPKESTLRAIKEAEGSSRGFYTGVFGYFDGTDLDTGVLIRFIAQEDPHTLMYYSGGGITINSDPQEEYQEVINKVYLPFT